MVRNLKSKKSKNGASLEQILSYNTASAIRDESYSVVVKVVDEMMKNPRIREKMERYAYEFFKALVEEWGKKYQS